MPLRNQFCSASAFWNGVVAPALRTIVVESEGCMRDAESLLDQAMAQGVVKSTAEYNQRLALLQQKYGEVGRATQAMEKATQGLNSAFNSVRNAVGAFGLAIGIGAMVAYGKAVFNTTADLQEQAD